MFGFNPAAISSAMNSNGFGQVLSNLAPNPMVQQQAPPDSLIGSSYSQPIQQPMQQPQPVMQGSILNQIQQSQQQQQPQFQGGGIWGSMLNRLFEQQRLGQQNLTNNPQMGYGAQYGQPSPQLYSPSINGRLGNY